MLKNARNALLILDLSAAVATILGGAAIVLGLDSFPREWLAGTPFGAFLVPGLILGVVVGGLSAIAAAGLTRTARLGGLLSLLAGAALAGFIVGELLLLNQNGAATSPRSPVEAVFLALGIAMAALGVVVWRGSAVTEAG